MPSEELTMVVAMLRAREPRPDLDLVQARAGLEALASGAPVAAGTRCEPLHAGDVPCEWIDATNGEGAQGVLLYLHGGGYCLGSVNTHRGLVSRLSAACALRGFAVDYRLAPEHPFPAAIDDATAAYRWLLDGGVPAEQVVIAGDSAGGGLTVATMLALRDAGDPLPAAGVCLSPWVDMEGTGESMESRAHLDPMVQRDGLLRMARAYLREADPRSPLAAPVHADLSGLPPLLIHVGTAETLLDDSVRLHERARAHGVEAELEAWDDMIHVWHAFAPLLPEAGEAIARVGDWVRARL